MRLISYAQNFEDVMLWRALRHVPRGAYIDIGAHDPRIDSVSRLFYDNDWRGIHVEPLQVYCELLRKDRPDESVLQAAVAENSGVMRFFEIPETGISTGRVDIAESHRQRGFKTNEIVVACVSLKQVFDVAEGRDIHWLKIDVEGLEEQVLRSWGASSARPWIVVVESTLPLTQIESFDVWEPELLSRGYSFVYFDGLNRFYVDGHHDELKTAFSVGPNVFDGFSFSGQASAPYCSEVKAQSDELLVEQTRISSLEIARLQMQLVELNNTRDELVLLIKQKDAKLLQRKEILSSLVAEKKVVESTLTGELLSLNERSKLNESRFQEQLSSHISHIETLQRALEQARLTHADQLAYVTAKERVLADELHKLSHRYAEDSFERENRLEEIADLHIVQAQRTESLLRQQHEIFKNIEGERVQDRLVEIERIDVLVASLRSSLSDARVIEARFADRETHLVGIDFEEERRFRFEMISRFDEQLGSVEQIKMSLDQIDSSGKLNDTHARKLAEELSALQTLMARNLSEHSGALAASAETTENLISEGLREISKQLEYQLQALTQFEEARRFLEHELRLEQSKSKRNAELIKQMRSSITWRLFSPFRKKSHVSEQDELILTSPHEKAVEVNNFLNQFREEEVPEKHVAVQANHGVNLTESREKFQSIMTNVTVVGSLSELLRLQEEDFVECAYLTLLGRNSDLSGLTYYTDRLRDGYSKNRIISQIYRTKDDDEIVRDLPGVKRLVAMDLLASKPIVGWFVRAISNVEGNSVSERRLRRIEFQMGAWMKKSAYKFESVDDTLRAIKKLVEGMADTVSNSNREAAEVVRQSESIVQSSGSEITFDEANVRMLSAEAFKLFKAAKFYGLQH